MFDWRVYHGISILLVQPCAERQSAKEPIEGLHDRPGRGFGHGSKLRIPQPCSSVASPPGVPELVSRWMVVGKDGRRFRSSLNMEIFAPAGIHQTDKTHYDICTDIRNTHTHTDIYSMYLYIYILYIYIYIFVTCNIYSYTYMYIMSIHMTHNWDCRWWWWSSASSSSSSSSPLRQPLDADPSFTGGWLTSAIQLQLM